jgi:hypothetical protein
MGNSPLSYAIIRNNIAVLEPSVNWHNEAMDPRTNR